MEQQSTDALDSSTPPPEQDNDRMDFSRWLPMLIALGLMGLQMLVWTIIARTDWHNGFTFYPLIYLPGIRLQCITSCLILLLIGFGVIWALSKTMEDWGSITSILIISLTFWFVVFVQTAWSWGSTTMTPADSIDHDSHTYRLVIQIHYDDITFYSYDTLIVYRCTGFGLLCNGIYTSDHNPDTYEPTSPAVTASRTGDLRLVRDDAGRLSIRYYDEVFFVTDTDE